MAKMTKQEAVQCALTELGNDAKPKQIQGFVKDNFGIEMGTDHISTAKGTILRKTKPAVRNGTAPTSKGKPADTILLQDIRTLKELVGRLGMKPVLDLIDVFAN
jgi:hypothetical protein